MALTMLALALAALATAEWLPEDVCESPDCALNALQLRANKTEQMEEAENRPREYCAKDVKISCKHGSCPNNKGVCDPHSKQCMCPHGQCELQGRCMFWLYNGPATRMCKQDTGHKCGNGHGECPPYRGVCSKDGRCMCRGELCAQDGKCQIDPVHLKRGFKWQKHTRLRLRDTELKCNRNSDCPTLRSGPMSCEKRKCLCFDGFEWNKKAEMCMQWPRGPPSHKAPSGHPPPASPSAQAPAPMAPAPMPMAPATAAPTAAAPATAAPTAAAPATAAPTAAAPAPAASPDIANMDWSKMDWSTFDWGSIDWGAMFNPQGAGAGAAPEGAPAPAPGAGGFDWTSIDWGAMWNPQGTGYPGAAAGVPAWNVR